MQTDVGWVLALVINSVSPHGHLHGACFSPRGSGNQCGYCSDLFRCGFMFVFAYVL